MKLKNSDRKRAAMIEVAGYMGITYQASFDFASEKRLKTSTNHTTSKRCLADFFHSSRAKMTRPGKKARNHKRILTFITIRYHQNGLPLSSMAAVALSQTW